MKKFFNKVSPQKSKPTDKGGQVKNGKRVFDKRSIVERRTWGLATRLQHVRNRGK